MRLFDINDIGIYVSSNYLQETNSIEISLLFDTRFSRRSIYLNRSLLTNSSMIVSWMSPLMVVYINCTKAGSFHFSIKNESDALSVPFFKPNSLMWGGNGEFFRAIREALIQTACVDAGFIFPNEFTQMTTTTTMTTITIRTTTQSSFTSSSTLISTIKPTINAMLSGKQSCKLIKI
jgi:hypothetical protein